MAINSVCGVILVSERAELLAQFYEEALGLGLKREDHGELAAHFGTDIGHTHFAIHPPENFGGSSGEAGPPLGGPRARTVAVAFDVDSIESYQSRVEEAGGRLVEPVHDEGFGRVATYRDPDGNLFELVELAYDYNP